MTVKHAVILMAGKGTRFLPATKAIAKELFPIGSVPALLYQLKECLVSGIEEVTIVISRQKKDVIKFLKPDKELEGLIQGTSKEKLLADWKSIVKNIKINFVYQGKRTGSGGAVYVAKKYTKKEPFIVLYGDDVCIPEEGQKPAAKQLIELYEQTGKYIIGALKVSDDVVNRYGVVVPGERLSEKVTYIKGICEKPNRGEQPSNIALLARYLVLPEVYENILKVKPFDNGEISFPEAIISRSKDDMVLACEFDAKYWDLGNKLEFIKCSISEGLKDKEISDALKQSLRELSVEK